MGGYLSGNRRPRANARPLTIERLRLDVGAFRRIGLPLDVVAPNAGALRMRLTTDTDTVARYTWQPVEPGAALEGGPVAPAGACLVTLAGANGPPLCVPIDWHRVGYGWRPLWRCPTCGRRVRILYGPTPADALAGQAGRWTCRTCAALAYESTRQPDHVRARIRSTRAAAAAGLTESLRAALHNALRAESGKPGGRLPVIIRRPRGMRLRTWLRRLDAWEHARICDELAMMAEFARGWPRALGGAEMDALRRDALDILDAARSERRAARAARAATGAASG